MKNKKETLRTLEKATNDITRVCEAMKIQLANIPEDRWSGDTALSFENAFVYLKEATFSCKKAIDLISELRGS